MALLGKLASLSVLLVEEITQCAMASGPSPLMSDSNILLAPPVTGPPPLTAQMEAVRTRSPDLSAAVMKSATMAALLLTAPTTSSVSMMSTVTVLWILTVTLMMESATSLLPTPMTHVPTALMDNAKEVGPSDRLQTRITC